MQKMLMNVNVRVYMHGSGSVVWSIKRGLPLF